ncbi:MAG: transposase [Nitrospira sp.]|nr:transposase [Nitrospira sp.]
MRVRSRKRSQFTDDERRQILSVGDNSTAKAVCRKYGISLSTFYRWRSLLGTTKQQKDTRLHDLESENRRLRNQVAELWLDYTSLRNALINGMGREC